MSEPVQASKSMVLGALASGLCMLVITAVSPFSEKYLLKNLVDWTNTVATSSTIANHADLYLAGIIGFGIVFSANLVVAYGLFKLLLPVDARLSSLASGFRLGYSLLSLYTLSHLVYAWHTAQLHNRFSNSALSEIEIFRYEWSLFLLLFSVHLMLTAIIVFKSGFIPKAIGLVVGTSSLCYGIFAFRPIFMPSLPDLTALRLTCDVVFSISLIAYGLRHRRVLSPGFLAA